MVTQEQMAGHINKAKNKLEEASKKIEDPKNDSTIRELKKKLKRLVRKKTKMDFMEKKATEKKKSKKEKGTS